MRNLKILIIILMMFVVCGCKKTDNRAGVSGVVTPGGSPMVEGSIIFTPVASEGGTVSNATASVLEGRYELKADKGLYPGEYVVSFRSVRQVPGKTKKSTNSMGDEFEVPVTENLIPNDYGKKSIQKVTINEGKNQLDFEVPMRTGK